MVLIIPKLSCPTWNAGRIFFSTPIQRNFIAPNADFKAKRTIVPKPNPHPHQDQAAVGRNARTLELTLKTA
jgi:hypothetical protein